MNQSYKTIFVFKEFYYGNIVSVKVQGGPKVSLHTLGLIPTSCFILEGCCFADGILYLLVRGFRRQNLKIRIS